MRTTQIRIFSHVLENKMSNQSITRSPDCSLFQHPMQDDCQSTTHKLFPTLLATMLHLKRCIGAVLFLLFLHSRNVDSLVQPWVAYQIALSVHPLVTKACTSASIMSISDALCQRLERSNVLSNVPLPPKQEKGHDLRRTRDVALTGLFWGGPLSHSWYSILEMVVTTHHKELGLLIRLALDATVFSPIAIFGYLTVRSFLAGQGSIKEIRAKLHLRYKPAVLSAWKFRPAANILNFWLIPVPYRVLYSNVVSLLWSGYLSHMNSRMMDPTKI